MAFLPRRIDRLRRLVVTVWKFIVFEKTSLDARTQENLCKHRTRQSRVKYRTYAEGVNNSGRDE